MVLDGGGLFGRSQDITFRYEEQKLQPNIASKEILLWHVPVGSTGESQSATTTWQVSNSADDWTGQTFTIGVNGPQTDVVCSAITFRLRRASSPGTLTCELTTVDGNQEPSTDVIASGTTDGDTLPTADAGELRKITFSSSVKLKSGVMYACYIRATGADVTNTWSMRYIGGAPYGNLSGVGAQVVSTSGAGGFTIISNNDNNFALEVTGDVILVNLFGTLKQIPLLDVVSADA